MNWSHIGIATVLRAAGLTKLSRQDQRDVRVTLVDEGYERVLKTAGLIKEAIRPQHFLQAVMPDNSDVLESLSRHFRKPFDIPTPHAKIQQRSLADKPLSEAIRRQWPKAPALAEKMEAAESTLIKDLREHPLSQIKPEEISVGFDPQGAYFDPGGGAKAYEISTNLQPGALLHEGRHAQQFGGAAGPTQYARMQGRPGEIREDTLMLERDANRYALGTTEHSDRDRAITGAAQGSYEHPPSAENLALEVASQNPRLEARAARLRELQQSRLTKAMDLRDRLPPWVRWGQSIDEAARVNFPKEHVLNRIDSNVAEIRGTQADIEDLVAQGQPAPERWLRRVEELDGLIVRDKQRLGNMTRIMAEDMASITPEDRAMWETLRRLERNPVAEEAITHNRNPVKSTTYWKDATPEMIEANRLRHADVEGKIRERLGPQTSTAYNDAVMEQLKRIGAPPLTPQGNA